MLVRIVGRIEMIALWAIIIQKLKENVATLVAGIIVAAAIAVWGWARSYIYVEIPTGAVVAFDLADGCPQDGKWTPFIDGNGRTIVGAFQGPPPSESGDDGQPIAVHKYHDRSGSESTKLSVANLPQMVPSGMRLEFGVAHSPVT
jgi:hypothetical protein